MISRDPVTINLSYLLLVLAEEKGKYQSKNFMAEIGVALAPISAFLFSGEMCDGYVTSGGGFGCGAVRCKV